MEPKLNLLFNQLEAQRSEILNALQMTAVDTLTSKPSPSQWSIAEIVSHLITAERLSLSYMRKKSQTIETLDDSGFYEMLKVKFFILSQHLPLRYKAPAALASVQVITEIAEIQHRWDKTRKELYSFLDTITANHLKKKIYKHPFAGRLDAAQALITLREHIAHHRPQIAKLIKR